LDILKTQRDKGGGKLRYTVTIERYEETQDELSEPIQTWVTVGTVPASVVPLNAREYFTAQAKRGIGAGV